MHVTIDETTAATSVQATATHRGWAWVGVLGAAAAIAGIAASLGADAAYVPEVAGDAEAMTTTLTGQVSSLLVFHVATMISVVTLPVFAAGLRRRLADQAPARSLTPDVAAFGLLLVSVAGLMGTALDTEFIFGLSEPERMVPETVAFYAHWIGTVGWLWVGAGLTGLAVGSAAIRQGAAPRWLGWVGVVLGGLTLLLGISPLQYMAGFTGPVLVLVLALGFALGDRVRNH